AAREGDATAAASMGDLRSGLGGGEPDLEDAVRWYRQAADSGHAGAARALVRALENGVEGKAGPAAIARVLCQALESGEPMAWPDLGRLMVSGALRPNAVPDLHVWLQRRIRSGDAEAGFLVGLCINNGIGTPVNEALARDYYLWAAGRDVLEATVAA